MTEYKRAAHDTAWSHLVPKPTPNRRSLHAIAQEVRQDWVNVNYAAAPYLSAMFQLDSIEDDFYEDSGKSVVLYFLSNATSWRGETARRVKAELKGMVANAA